MQKITPFLWFNDKAEEAANFYISVFKNSKIKNIARYDKEGPKTAGRPEGTVMTVEFEIGGLQFVALNGGPAFKFSPAISFLINCESQEEVDELWEKLSEGGSKNQCGWLDDKFGVSWQVVPIELGKLLSDPDPEKAQRVMQAMLQMKKIDIEGLRKAYENK